MEGWLCTQKCSGSGERLGGEKWLGRGMRGRDRVGRAGDSVDKCWEAACVDVKSAGKGALRGSEGHPNTAEA